MVCLKSTTMLWLMFSIGQVTIAGSPSDESPVDGLPFEMSLFTRTVASVQNTYCGDAANQPGQKFGDQTLLHAIGNGDSIQRANIYHSDSLGIIVAYMGTNVSSIISCLHDVDAPLVSPNSALGLPVDALVMQGFQNAWEASWDDVKNAIYESKAKYPNAKIVVTGHSLGAAQALFGALSINHEFGNVIDKIVTYGGPRVGNQIFADNFDKVFKGRFTGVVNGNDWVPSVPTEGAFWHPSGLVWINPANSTNFKFYPGQENIYGPDSRTPEIFYPNTLQFYWGDHQGIYMNSSMGTNQGPCPAKVGGY